VLAGANPDLGVLDEVADSTIQITSLAAAQIVGDEAEVVTRSEAMESLRTAEIAAVPAVPPAVTLSKAKEQVSSDNECRHCHHAMPAGRQIVFCPWCGERLIPFTCARCQTELDSEWRHCITCGAPVKDPHRYR
jgi:DNA-directed RNA polymerase subunit RPC12/RpoP